MKFLAEGHTASKWQSRVLNSVGLATESFLSTSVKSCYCTAIAASLRFQGKVGHEIKEAAEGVSSVLQNRTVLCFRPRTLLSFPVSSLKGMGSASLSASITSKISLSANFKDCLPKWTQED